MSAKRWPAPTALLELGLCLLGALAGSPAPGAADAVVLQAGGAAVVRARAAALLLSDGEGGPLAVQVLAVPLPGEGGPAAVLVEVPGRQLLPTEARDSLEVEVFVYALGGGGAVLASATQHVALDAPEHRAVLAGSGLKAVVVLSLEAGDQHLRVLVRSSSGSYGLRSHRFRLDPSSAVAGPLLVPETEGPWLVLQGPATEEARPRSGYPLEIGGHFLLPRLRPMVALGETLSGWLLLRNPEAGGLVARFRSLAGGGITSLAASMGPSSPLAGGWWLQELSLPTADLRGGPYEVTLAPPGPVGADPVPLSVFLEEPPGSPPRQARRWQAPAATSQGGRKALEREVEEIRSLLLAGDLESVGRSLDRILVPREEMPPRPREGILLGLLTETPGAGREAARRRVAWSFALVELALEYIRRRDYAVGRRASRLAASLLDGAPDPLPPADLRRDGARLLSALGAGWLDAGALTEAARLLERSLALEVLPEAALPLSTVYEKQGRYGEASQSLRRLLKREPEHRRARLHLAMNLRRTGRPGEARKVLRRLVEAPQEDWPVLLAFQELARLEADQGRRRRALALLEKAARRWPENPRIRIQRASLLESMGEVMAAQRLLSQRPPGPRRGISERQRFNRWPEDRWPLEREQVRRRLVGGQGP